VQLVNIILKAVIYVKGRKEAARECYQSLHMPFNDMITCGYA